jgi:uncharacterized protein GlcG (DUF336 family)
MRLSSYPIRLHGTGTRTIVGAGVGPIWVVCPMAGPSGEKRRMSPETSQQLNSSLTVAEGGHMIMGQGAVPIIRNGVIEGACGVSGGTAQQDEDCSRAGVAQL